MNIRLSKTRFIAGLQCEKRLYLSVYPPELGRDKNFFENMAIYNGYAFGEMACKQFPGVMVEYDPGLKKGCVLTRQLIADPDVTRIHEAAFEYKGTVVGVDLLERDGDGWRIIEVKSSTSVKEYYLNDVTLQAWVLRGCGVKVTSIYVMHVNNQFVYLGDDDYEGLFTRVDVSEIVEERIISVDEKHESFVTMLKGEMPSIEIGKHCTKPFSCEFFDYCKGDGYVEPVKEVPARKDKDKEQALDTLTNLPFPRYFLDFETVGLAVPKWKGLRPFVQVPFQWSCHVVEGNGSVEHYEFLDLTGEDPRRSCAEALVKSLGNRGVVIAYNASFEQRVLKSLAGSFPDLRGDLMNIHDRCFDLLSVTRRAYYHPSQNGSWSLKAVLPTLVPELSYGDLPGVRDGNQAQLAWFKGRTKEGEDLFRLESELLAYCKLDTLAMVRMMDELVKTLKH